MNPYMFMRTHLRISQVALSRRSELSEQYMRRLEHGTVSNPSAKVTQALLGYAESKQKAQSFVDLCVREAGLYKATLNVTPANFEQFVEKWWAAWVKRTRANRTSEDIRSCTSVYSLCRMLVLHPYVVQYYAKGRPEMEMPEDIEVALSDAGLSAQTFEEVLTAVSKTKGDRAPRKRATTSG